jgi:hypothetical protein
MQHLNIEREYMFLNTKIYIVFQIVNVMLDKLKSFDTFKSNYLSHTPLDRRAEDFTKLANN